MLRTLRIVTSLLLIVAPFMVSTVQAQVYPIQVSAQITAPYTPYLFDYSAPGAQRLRVNFLLKDPTLPEYRGKLRITIEGVGITIRTKQNFTPAQPLVLPGGGVPHILYGEDLEEYLRPGNLDFAGITRAQYEKGAKLPEGIYRFVIEVLDFNRNTVVSNKGTAMAWIILNDPPLLNLPRNDTKIQILDPTNIPFTWTPRHTGSPNAAFTTEYIFRLVEIWPLNRNPYDAFLSQPTLYETTTNLTQIVYGPAEPALLPGRKYAWQVQAKDTEGRDLFKNDGKSEVHVFQFGDALGIPENLILQSSNASSLTVRWDQPTAGTGAVTYRTRYRPHKNRQHEEWYEATTGEQWRTLMPLQPNTEYEVQVRAEQSPQVSHYSATQVFKTAPAGANDFACKSDVTPPPIPPAGTPVFPLSVNDTIHAGGYDVLVRSVTAGTGNSYTGEGFAIVPWFHSAKVRVTFKNIKVNEQFWLTSGEIKSVWNADSKFLLKVEKPSNGVNSPPVGEIPTVIAETDSLVVIKDGAIGEVRKNEDGDIVVTKTDGETIVLPKDKSYSIVDEAGNGYIVDKEGNIAKTTATEAAAAAARGDRNYNIALKFEKAGKFGFDEKQYDALSPYYQQLENGEYIAWKAVSSEPDAVNAVITGSDIVAAKIRFEAGSTPVMPTGTAGSTIALNVTGKAGGTVEELLALYPAPADSTQNEVIGKLNLVSYDKVSNNLVIVPVNNTTLPGSVSESSIQNTLNAIYGQAVAEWKVSVASPLKVTLPATFDDGESGLLSNYTADMKAVIKAYGKLQDKTYYLFLVDNPKSGTTALGYMPRSKQAGFIFVGNHAKTGASIGHTIAHELGHGAFNLQHTFDEFAGLNKGTTDNLMDYPNGPVLNKHQWDFIHDPQTVLGLFEDDEDAESVIVRKMADLEAFNNKDHNGTYTFITPAGNYFTLPADVSAVKFSTLDRLFYVESGQVNMLNPSENLLPLGSLSGFTLDNITWYYARVKGDKFLGYVKEGTDEIYPKNQTPVPTPPNTTSGIAMFVGVENGTFVSYAARFKSSAVADLTSQDGSGNLLKSFSVLDFNTGLDKSLKSFLTDNASSDQGLKTIQKPEVYLTNKDVSLKMITGDKTGEQFLQEVLNDKSTVKDYIAYFQVVNLKENELTGLFQCVSERQRIELLTLHMLLTNAMNKALYGESGRLTEASQVMVNVKNKTLEELVNYAKVDMNVVAKIKAAIAVPNKSAEDLYDLLTNPYHACSFTGFDISTRIKLINALLSDNDLWEYGDYNVINDLVASTPTTDRVKLLKDGFMANSYSWMSTLWKGAVGAMNGVDYEDVVDVFNTINPWIQTSFNELNIKLTLNRKPIGTGLFDLQSVEYPAGMDEFIVGAASENSYYFPDTNHSVWVGPMDEAGDITFTQDGKIRLQQEYSVIDRRHYIVSEGSPSPSHDFDVNYDQSLQVFEPLKLKVAKNYAALNLDAGTEMVVPAYMALVYDHDIRKEISAQTSRKAWNIVEISLAIILAPETGGGSLAVLANVLTAAGAVSAAADIVIQEEKNSLSTSQLAANAKFYRRWDAFKTAVDYANLSTAGVTLGAKAIPRLGEFTRKLNVVKTWNAVSEVATLKAGKTWTQVISVAKNSSALLSKFSKIPKAGSKILKAEGSATWIAEVSQNENKIFVNVDEIVDESIATVEKAENVTIVYRKQNIDLLEEAGDVAIGFKNGAYCVIGNYLCFTGETPIATPNGNVRIDQVSQGMEVYSRDEKTGNNTIRRVNKLMKSVAKRLIKISVAGNILFATATHPFYANGHWEKAENLKTGDTLVSYGHQPLLVDQVQSLDTLATVYNFEVQGDHSYFAGTSSVWVHNKCLLDVVGKERFTRVLQWAINRGDNIVARTEFYNQLAGKLQTLTAKQLDELMGTVVDGKASGGLFFEGTVAFQNKIADFVKTGSAESTLFWNDIVSGTNTTWKRLIATHGKGVKAWEVLGKRTFRTSTDNITKVADILSTRHTVSDGLLKKAIDFATDGKVHKWSGQNLIDALHKMKDKPGIDKMISNLGSDYNRYRKGAGFVLYKANQLGANNIARFESTDIGNNLTRIYDIILNTTPVTSVECKSWDAFYSSTIQSQFYNKDLLKFNSFSELRYFVDESLMSLDDWYTKMKDFMGAKTGDLYAASPSTQAQQIKALFASEASKAGMTINTADEFRAFLDKRDAWFDIIFKQDF